MAAGNPAFEVIKALVDGGLFTTKAAFEVLTNPQVAAGIGSTLGLTQLKEYFARGPTANNHGLGPDSERASGTRNYFRDEGHPNENFLPGAGNSLLNLDGGQINKAQQDRLDELRNPTEGSADNPEAVQGATTAPDNVEHIIPVNENKQVASLASRHLSKVYAPDEAHDMGLFNSSTEQMYQATAVDIRNRDKILGSVVISPSHNKRYYDGSRPPPKRSKVALSQQLPGSAAATFVTRAENPITNDLEQICVTNPEARRQLLDKGTFCTHYRALGQYPAAMRQFLEPYTGYQPNF